MTYQERRSLSNIVMNIIITGVYFIIVYNKYNAGDFDTENMAKLWSLLILIFIPISVGARIILLIIFRIFAEVFDEVRGTKEIDRDITDERDKLIELKAGLNGLIIFAIGFIIALITQVMDYDISALFISLLVGGFLSELVSNISEIYYYRRGV